MELPLALVLSHEGTKPRFEHSKDIRLTGSALYNRSRDVFNGAVKSSGDYASVAIFEVQEDDSIVIETLGILAEGCALSGAWHFDAASGSEVEMTLEGRLLIQIGTRSLPQQVHRKFESNFIAIEDLLSTASIRAHQTISEYEDYKAQEPSARKKLVEPNVSEWPLNIDLNEARTYLVTMRKMASVRGTPREMDKVLTASRLLQILISNWLNDESVRAGKRYLSPSLRNRTLLPKQWMAIALSEEKV